MVTRLNVCMISREFPPDTAFGGIATFSLDTARMLKAHGHDVTVFSQSLGPSQVLDYGGIEVRKLHIPAPFGSYRFLPSLILGFNAVVFRAVQKVHRERPFDLIDVPDHLAEGLFAVLSGRLPVVTRLHTPFALLVAMGLNDYRKGPSYWFIKALERIALSRSTVLYAPCLDLVRRSEKLFAFSGVPARVFGYPLDLSLFAAQPAAPLDDGQPRILFVGRLEHRKGIETIAEAFPKVRAACPGAQLTLLGSDTPNIRGHASARQFLEAAFTATGDRDHVDFKDHVPLQQLPGIFHDYDIVWVPSLYDNFPITCLEAMACGKAVVVSDAGGLPEMVRHDETGLVFPAGDATALANMTLVLCRDALLRQRLGQNARDYSEQSCSDDIIYAHTLALYRAALGDKLEAGK